MPKLTGKDCIDGNVLFYIELLSLSKPVPDDFLSRVFVMHIDNLLYFIVAAHEYT